MGVFHTSDITELISRLRPPTPAGPRAGGEARSRSSSTDDSEDEVREPATIAGVPCPF